MFASILGLMGGETFRCKMLVCEATIAGFAVFVRVCSLSALQFSPFLGLSAALLRTFYNNM